jgi:hypothetical protein
MVAKALLLPLSMGLTLRRIAKVCSNLLGTTVLRTMPTSSITMEMNSHRDSDTFASHLGLVNTYMLTVLIGISVDNLDAACKQFEEHGVNWKKRLTDGRMRNIAFVLDPDNYWIEVVQNEALRDSGTNK